MTRTAPSGRHRLYGPIPLADLVEQTTFTMDPGNIDEDVEVADFILHFLRKSLTAAGSVTSAAMACGRFSEPGSCWTA